jgi:ribonuclease HI
MGKPTKLHDVQKLAGRVAALSRFVARLGEKALPFYALMKKSDDKFEWTEEADTAFVQLKKVLSTPPVLVAPKEKEPLLLYIAATHQVVSTVLGVERSEEGKAHGVQWPVYFVSEVLSPTKQRYPHYQKLAYSVFTTAQKLRQYFVVHPIIVVNEAPLSNILNAPLQQQDVSPYGELSYHPWTSRMKSERRSCPKFYQISQQSGWTYKTQGHQIYRVCGQCTSTDQKESKAQEPQGDKLKYMLRMSFPQASNNEAKYEALLHGMKMAKACGATRLKIFGDSNLIVQQVMNKCDAIIDNMTAYINLYYYLEGTFDGCEVLHVSRASNEEANNLANIGSQCLPVPQGVFWEEIIERSIKSTKVSTTGEQVQRQATGSGAGNSGTAEPEEVMMIEETWMQPYLAYMVNKTLPKDYKRKG